MPLSGTGPPLIAGLLAGLLLSWWERPSPTPIPASAPAPPWAQVPLACPAPEGWASWAVAAAFVGGILVAGSLVLCGACAVFGAGYLWSRLTAVAPQRRTIADRLSPH